MVMMATAPGMAPPPVASGMPHPVPQGMGGKATTGTPSPGGMATPQPFRGPMGPVRPGGGMMSGAGPVGPQMQIANSLRNAPVAAAPGLGGPRW